VFNTTNIHPWRIPSSMEPKFNFVYWATFISLGFMFAGMISASIYQHIYIVGAKTLLEAPLPMQVLIVGGFLSFLSMLIGFIALLVWCDVKEFILKRPLT